MDEKDYVKALVDERRGYELKADAEGLAAVDAELKRLKATTEAPRRRAQKRA